MSLSKLRHTFHINPHQIAIDGQLRYIPEGILKILCGKFTPTSVEAKQREQIGDVFLFIGHGRLNRIGFGAGPLHTIQNQPVIGFALRFTVFHGKDIEYKRFRLFVFQSFLHQVVGMPDQLLGASANIRTNAVFFPQSDRRNVFIELPPKAALKMACIIVMSAPFVYAIMRGNTIYFAMIFLLLFFLLYQSDNAVLRELGYLALVVAGLIKIYPLFFGVFLLCKKKLWASVRIGIYTVTIFLLSFLLFRGMDDFLPFFDNLGGFMSNELRLLANNNISISAQIYKLLHLFVPKLTAESIIYSVFNLSLLAIVFALGTYTAVATRSNLSRYSICFAVVTLIPSISYFYTMIFAILPFLEYIRVFDTLSKRKQIFYFCAFAFLFSAILVFPKYFVIHSLVIITIFIAETRSVIKERISAKHASLKNS